MGWRESERPGPTAGASLDFASSGPAQSSRLWMSLRLIPPLPQAHGLLFFPPVLPKYLSHKRRSRHGPSAPRASFQSGEERHVNELESLFFSLSHFLSLFITVPYNYLLDVHFFLLVYLFHKNRACMSCVYCSTPHLEQRLLYHKPLEESSRGNLSNCKLTEQFDLAHFYWTLGFTCSLLFDPGLLLSYFLETDPRQIACRSHLMCSFHF